MEISQLGEFKLIERLTKDITPVNPSTIMAAGDDSAVINQPQDTHTLITTDMYMQGVHFDLTYISMQHLGYKIAMANISDIIAMNGTPRQMTVAVALSKGFSVEDIDALYSGLRMACSKHGVDIIGGDTTSSMTGLAICITCIGEAAPEDIITRSGAHDTDLVCVSGNLGAAYMGLQILEREKAVYYQQVKEISKKYSSPDERNRHIEALDFSPDFIGKEYLLERQMKPEARVDILRSLREAGVRPTSMIDVSDGLASDIMQICKSSDCGCRIYEKNIPIDYQTAVTAEEFNMNLTTCALNGGDDYELIFTVPIGDLAKVECMEDVKIIGHITRPELGYILVTRDDNEFELKAQGWK